MSSPVNVLVVPALYPHRTLDHEAAKDPESVLRWAGTWLSGAAAHHGELLRAAADTVATREAAVAELIEAATVFVNDDRQRAWHPSYRPQMDALRAALARVGGPA